MKTFLLLLCLLIAAGDAASAQGGSAQGASDKDSSGAPRNGHWAFRPPVQPPLPLTRYPRSAHSAIDLFIQRALHAKGLALGPQADRRTLIRRVALDLVGVPPTPAEVDAYLQDESPAATASMIDRYLASPAYGERWGKYWLDAAGYADSNGYRHADSDRPLAWRYRDYVIRSFNDDKPYDRFIHEQLAGDEIAGYVPDNDITAEMKELLIATHFLRNAPDGSGGSDGNPDELRQDRYYVLEGVLQNTMNCLGGIMIQCARCHDHKLEPITQKEYYELQAIFFAAFCPEPFDRWRTPDERIIEVGTDTVLHQSFGDGEDDAPPGQLDRIPDLSGNDNQLWSMSAPPTLDSTISHTEFNDGPTPPYTMTWNGGTATMAPTNDVQRGQFYWAADIRITPNGRGAGQGGIATGNNYVFSSYGDEIGAGGEGCRLRVNSDGSVSAFAEYTSPVTYITTSAGLVSDNTWVHLALSFESASDGGKSVGGDPVGAGRQIWDGTLKVYVNGTLEASAAASHVLNDAGYVPTLGQQRHDLGVSPNMAFDNILIKGAEQEQISVLVETDPNPPAHHLLVRGSYTDYGQEVEPGVPAVLTGDDNSYLVAPPSMGSNSSGRRSALARWLTSPGHPLFSRVMVNRIWQHHFGEGIVSTPNNLGMSGARPSNQELLDYLAVEFIRGGWSVKRMHRLIMNSNVYKQSSAVRDDGLAADPDNRLWWRFPIRRLDAEAIRDSMLSVSGKVTTEQFGPYVPVVQLDDGRAAVEESNPGALRRSIYLQQKRTRVLSLLEVFDAPSMARNCAQRHRSAVALQSLSLLNSDFVLSCSQAFAANVLQGTASGGGDDQRLDRAHLLALAREPTAGERAALHEFLNTQRALYGDRPDGEETVWKELCQMIFASNSFLYIE